MNNRYPISNIMIIIYRWTSCGPFC